MQQLQESTRRKTLKVKDTVRNGAEVRHAAINAQKKGDRMLGWESGKAKELQDVCLTLVVYPTSCSSHKHHRRQHQNLAHVAKGKNCQTSPPTAINMQPNTSGRDRSRVHCIITGQKVARHVAHRNQAGTSMKPRNFFPEMLP